jgi:hypothetical protein
MIHDQIISGLYTTLINLSPTAYKERKKEERERERERERRSSYSHYSSLALLGGTRATDGGTLDDNDIEAQWVWVQRTSISSFDWLALYTDPSNSNSSFNLGKCDKTVVSASWAPQWTPLMAVASMRPSICFTIDDRATTREGVSSDLSSTRSQIRVAELRRAWSSSRITQSCPAASSTQATRWARPCTSPRARS